MLPFKNPVKVVVLVAQDVVCHADFGARVVLQNHAPERRPGLSTERVAPSRVDNILRRVAERLAVLDGFKHVLEPDLAVGDDDVGLDVEPCARLPVLLRMRAS